MTPKHVCKKIRGRIRRSDCVGPFTKSYLTSKVDTILKLSNYKATTKITHVFRTKVQMSTPFFGDIDCLPTCSMSPCQAVDEQGFYFVSISPEVLHLLRPNIEKKYKKEHLAKKNKNSVTGRRGLMEQLCQISRSNKNGLDIGCFNKLGAICLNQSVPFDAVPQQHGTIVVR